MSDTQKTTRRGFLAGGAIAAGGALTAGAARAAGDPAIMEVKPWASGV